MIVGVGIDLCTIDRMDARNGRFLDKVLTENERRYVEQRGVAGAASLAAAFAAKEAFLKAAGTGFGGAPMRDIEVLHDENGRPFYCLHGQAEQLCRKMGVTSCHLSLSHEGNTAAAVAVLEKER